MAEIQKKKKTGGAIPEIHEKGAAITQTSVLENFKVIANSSQGCQPFQLPGGLLVYGTRRVTRKIWRLPGSITRVALAG